VKTLFMDQGSDEWFEARKGIPTCSEFDRILTGGGKLSKQADEYAHELIGQKYSLIPPEGVESFTNRSVRWGQATEDQARRRYEMEIKRAVTRVGFCTSDDGRFGGSPDGLVDDIGGLELKCPQPKAHVGYCLARDEHDNPVLPLKYKPQVHGHLWISKRAWWDFFSFCPGLPPFLIRVCPDEYTEALGKALEEFDGRLKELERKIMEGNL